MTLKGNLRDFTLTQVLNLINLAQKTGSLDVEGSNEEVSVFFLNGKLAYAQVGEEDDRLANILHKMHRISTTQYRGIVEHTQNMSDKELGLLLVNANYFSQQDILASLQTYFADVLKRLFTWVEGFFQFENGVTPPEDRITVRLSLENLILEGTRQQREWEHLKEEIPSLDMALKFVDRPGVNIRNIKLNAQEWQVINFVNPKNTIRQIARANKMSDLEIRRIVYSLLQAGLVEMIRPLGSPSPAQTQANLPVETKPANKEERKSLINRIIDRIRSL